MIFDGSFEGWLTVVFEVYDRKIDRVIIHSESDHQPELLDKEHRVITDPEKSKRVWQGLARKVSSTALRQVYRSFLSEERTIGNTLLAYVQHAFASAVSIEYDYSNAAVLKVHQLSKMVYRERHRMEAFVRFQLTKDNLYYSLIQPDFNVLPLIQKHFKERYPDQRWLIYDSKRRYGIYYDLENVSEVQMLFEDHPPDDVSAVYDENEELYQSLWRQYFSSVNIASRKNTKLHLQHMPRRYWKNLIEKKMS